MKKVKYVIQSSKGMMELLSICTFNAFMFSFQVLRHSKIGSTIICNYVCAQN